MIYPPADQYALILPLPPKGESFIHMPGVYCQNCGTTLALYSWSMAKPDGVDENQKPYYKCCGLNGCRVQT